MSRSGRRRLLALGLMLPALALGLAWAIGSLSDAAPSDSHSVDPPAPPSPQPTLLARAATTCYRATDPAVTSGAALLPAVIVVKPIGQTQWRLDRELPVRSGDTIDAASLKTLACIDERSYLLYYDAGPPVPVWQVRLVRWSDGRVLHSETYRPPGFYASAAYGDQAIHAVAQHLVHPAMVARVAAPADETTSVALSNDATRFAVVGKTSITLWDVVTGKQTRTIRAEPSQGSLKKAAFSPDGRELATGTIESGKLFAVVVWNLATAKRQAVTQGGHTEELTAVVFSPDGRILASASLDGTVKLWDAASGRGLRTLTHERGEPEAVAFSADGRTLETTGSDASVRVWDVESGAVRQTFRGSTSGGHSAAWSPDGAVLAAALDQSISLWSLPSGRKLRELPQAFVLCVAFSPRGRLLAASTGEPALRVWEVATGKELATLMGGGPATSVVFSADGSRLYSAGEDGVLKTWDLSVAGAAER